MRERVWRRLTLQFVTGLLVTTASSLAVAAQPSWFPKLACSVAWKNRDLAKFDPSLDKNYLAYRTRLAKLGVGRASCYKDWTVLVYMAADNDLSRFALWDLHEMEGSFASGNYAASTLKSDLLVQADTAGATGIRRFHMFQNPGTDYIPPKSAAEFDLATIDQVRSPVVELIAEKTPATSLDHKKRMRAFLDWGMRTYPAQHYFVIVWGHGQGWAADGVAPRAASRYVKPEDIPITFDTDPSLAGDPAPVTHRFGGLAFSETPGDYLGIPALSAILHDTVSQTLEGLRTIDVYAADACLMQMLEVANEISSSVRFVIGSAQVQTYLGLPYRQLMYQINTGRFGGAGKLVGSDDEPYLLAKMLPTLAQGSLDPARGQQGRADQKALETFTMSSLSSADLQSQLVPALRELGRALSAYIIEEPMRAADLQFIVKSTPSFMGGSRELGSFLGLLEIQLVNEARERKTWTLAAQRVRNESDAVRRAIGLAVLNYGIGTGYRASDLHLLGFRSLGVWLPQSQAEFTARASDFEASKFYSDDKSGTWVGWLTRLYR